MPTGCGIVPDKMNSEVLGSNTVELRLDYATVHNNTSRMIILRGAGDLKEHRPKREV